MDSLLFYALILTSIINLVQIFFYGLQEQNRPNILFGIILFFFAFAFQKPDAWIKWGVILVNAVGLVGTLSGFSDSLKPNWLNYLMMFFYLSVCIISLFYYFN